MEIKLSEELKKEMSGVASYGYGGVKEFIEDAIRRRILDLKKIEFLSVIGKIRDGMKKRGLKEEDILENFEKFSHRK